MLVVYKIGTSFRFIIMPRATATLLVLALSVFTILSPVCGVVKAKQGVLQAASSSSATQSAMTATAVKRTPTVIQSAGRGALAAPFVIKMQGDTLPDNRDPKRASSVGMYVHNVRPIAALLAAVKDLDLPDDGWFSREVVHYVGAPPAGGAENSGWVYVNPKGSSTLDFHSTNVGNINKYLRFDRDTDQPCQVIPTTTTAEQIFLFANFADPKRRLFVLKNSGVQLVKEVKTVDSTWANPTSTNSVPDQSGKCSAGQYKNVRVRVAKTGKAIRSSTFPCAPLVLSGWNNMERYAKTWLLANNKAYADLVEAADDAYKQYRNMDQTSELAALFKKKTLDPRKTKRDALLATETAKILPAMNDWLNCAKGDTVEVDLGPAVAQAKDGSKINGACFENRVAKPTAGRFDPSTELTGQSCTAAISSTGVMSG